MFRVVELPLQTYFGGENGKCLLCSFCIFNEVSEGNTKPMLTGKMLTLTHKYTHTHTHTHGHAHAHTHTHT